MSTRNVRSLFALSVVMTGAVTVASAQTGPDAPKPVGLVLETPDAIAPQESGFFDALAGLSTATMWISGAMVLGVVVGVLAIGWIRQTWLKRDPGERTLQILARAAGLGRGDMALLKRLARAHPEASACTLLLSDSALREACARLGRADPAAVAGIGRLRSRLGA